MYLNQKKMNTEDNWCHYSGMSSPNAYYKTKMRFEIYEIAWAMALVILAYMWAKKRSK